MKASVTLSISVVTVTESTGSRSKTTLGSKSCSAWGSGWCRWAVAMSSVHMPITLLEDQRPRHIAQLWREPRCGTDADNSPSRTVALVDDPGADPARQQLGAQHQAGRPCADDKTWHSEDAVLIRATMDPCSARVVSVTTSHTR